jgi:hypothetical protein
MSEKMGGLWSGFQDIGGCFFGSLVITCLQSIRSSWNLCGTLVFWCHISL